MHIESPGSMSKDNQSTGRRLRATSSAAACQSVSLSNCFASPACLQHAHRKLLGLLQGVGSGKCFRELFDVAPRPPGSLNNPAQASG